MEVKGNFINYGSYIDVHDNEVVNLTVDKGKVKVDKAELTASGATGSDKEESPESCESETCESETFADRVKAIMRKAAEKNGQRVTSNARGNTCTYLYYIDADAFCKAMDDMVSMHGEKLKAFLGGTMQNVQVTKVCFFIGQTISRQIINDSQLQLADMFFAFEKYYKLSTVQSRLSVKSCSDEESVLLGTFEGLLRTCKT